MSFGQRQVSFGGTWAKAEPDHYIGLEYQAVVEYAPVQKTPLKTKAKNDARQGTIDEGR